MLPQCAAPQGSRVRPVDPLRCSDGWLVDYLVLPEFDTGRAGVAAQRGTNGMEHFVHIADLVFVATSIAIGVCVVMDRVDLWPGGS